ncbi:methionine gamma-lyase family protein [Salimicrobium halophilum]|uniref:Cystathionine beta-lyase family protein involved in aluminum resistance n=1 Tax=Salimicrobium halophilum TaxID=86666 RepID=A0A1G8Q757_9BACI|nr:methionine gamma-lyase family protein [Salimicrobium halophilum]SDJ00255.1 Cystathionine beta-lyase family protein involved in aluminum resistance [Salimicrobium halophilum]
MNKEANIEEQLRTYKENIEKVVLANQEKVLNAFQEMRVSDRHFHSETGYGYDDEGRETLERVYAEIFRGEDALVRPQFVSGTHAISTAFFGILRPGDKLVYITGDPYDTLEEVIASSDGEDNGSLYDYGISYESMPLVEGSVDSNRFSEVITPETKMVAIQRSKGYADRPSFTIDEIEGMIAEVRKVREDVIVFVDNCYGEFVETQEPTEVGADLIAGSLIKNPGGGIVRTGGYIAGRKDLIDKCAHRLTAPGLGKGIGASLSVLQEMYQGVFLAPHMVGEALKGALFTAKYLEEEGFTSKPSFDEKRTDLIQAVYFDEAEQMVEFCRQIQAASPVNAFVRPEPSPLPGYESEVIMAAGTFVQGASLELTADGPVRPPYMAFVQGGLTYEHVKIAVQRAVQAIQE